MLALFLERLLALDIHWLASLLLNNWLWAFIFLAVSYFMFGQKRMVPGFFVALVLTWSYLDFNRISGLGLIDPKYLMFSMFTLIMVGMFAETSARLSKHYVFISSLRWILVVVVFNLFMRF